MTSAILNFQSQVGVISVFSCKLLQVLHLVRARTIGCSIQSFFYRSVIYGIPGISNRNIWSNGKRHCSLWSLDRMNMCFCVVEFQASVSLFNSPFKCNVI